MKNIILIDGSYFIFYRFHALKIWWNLAKKDNETNIPCENERFLNKFRETFVKKMNELNKKLKIDDSIKIFAKDCKRNKIWRNESIENYKATRINDNDVGNVFKIAYDEELYKEANCNLCLYHEKLEADDCIAIMTKKILENYPESKIWIITNDMDYLQLASTNVNLINLKFKDITKNLKWFDDPQKNLFCKIVAGDKSDNILPIFDRCGFKTASKYYDDPKLFEKVLNENEGSRDKYNHNKKMIDFNEIPEELVNEFTNKYNEDLISLLSE